MISTSDIVVETYTPAVCTAEVSMLLRHIPTGIYVSGKDNSRWKLYGKLFKELEEKVNEQK